MLHIGLLGMGAIGSLMAYHWQAHRLYYLPKNPHNTNSLTLELLPQAIGQSTLWHQTLPTWQQQSLDWLVICTKAADTIKALQPWKTQLSHVKNIALIQNGMGQQQLLEDFLQQAELSIPLWVGMCTEGAYRLNHQIIYAGQGQTFIGPWQASHLHSPALPPRLTATDHIKHLLRQKLAINAVINPLTGYFKCLNGELVSQPVYLEHLLNLSEEISSLYDRLNWPLDQPLAAQAQNIAQATASNRSSTLQDLLAHRPTELAYISGYLLAQAKTVRHPLPLTEHLFHALHQD